jgi:phage portal protein BeeE
MERAEGSSRFVMDQYITDYLFPSQGQFTYNGQNYPFGGLAQTANGPKIKELSRTLPGYTAAALRCPPVFAAQMKRAMVLSQARFCFRARQESATPRKIFGNRDLGVLERPWTNATQGELISRMEWHAGFAGNSYVTNWEPNRLRVLRPDWVGIVYGSRLEPDDAGFALDGEVIGYAYQNGGFGGQNRNQVRTLRPEEVAHWSPLPDPLSPGIGMSWVTPAVRDMQGDQAMTEHKLRFFENGASLNLVIKGLPAVTKEQFDEIVDRIEAGHTGVRNAYKTLYLNAGADVTVVGADLQQLDFANTQGKGETRLAMLSGVPAPILQISEGLSGSSLNEGNFAAARDLWADSWILPTLQDMARALSPMVRIPTDSELWTDTSDMPILRVAAKDMATILQLNATTIGGLVKDGFTPESSVKAVIAQDMNLLKPIPGWISVQMRPINGSTTASPVPDSPAAS